MDQEKKYLIISCDDLSIYVVNMADKDKSMELLNISLTSIPLCLKSFASAKIFAVGDTNNGVAYIYGYNENLKRFDSLITFESNKDKDILISIEL